MPTVKIPDFGAGRIFLVENDLVLADRLTEILREAGFIVQNAYNFGDAMAANHERFNLAIIDAGVRDFTGKRILDEIKDHPTFGKVPVLTLTAHPKSWNALSPDCSNEELLLAVRQILEGQSMPSILPPPAEEPPKVDPLLLQQLAELKTLSQLGRSISSVLDLSGVLNQIVEAATTLTNAEEGMLLLPDDSGKNLYIRAMKGVDDDSARSFRIKTQDPMVGSVYTSGEPLLLGDRGLQRVKTEYFVKSLLYVPLKSKGRVIGVLGINNRHEDRMFSPHDMDLMLDLAAYATIAIENARLYETSQQKNRQLTTLVDAGRAVNSSLSLEDVLFTLCEQINQALNVHACLINQKDETTALLRPLASGWRSVWRPHPNQGPMTLLEERPVLKTALSQIAFYSVSIDTKGSRWESERVRLTQHGARHMIMLPVRAGSQPPIGIIELFYQGELPEITDEFRAGIRTTALEIFALATQPVETDTNSFPQNAILNDAEKILEHSGAQWLIISILQDDQCLTQLVKCGAGLFLDDLHPTGGIFPRDMSLFTKMEPLNFQIKSEALAETTRSAMKSYGAMGMLCLPLSIKGRAFVTIMYDTLHSRRFTPEEVGLALALLSQAATAIENARLYRDLQRSLTELKTAQSNLVQATRLSTMGQLSAVVAHQINNPLTTIMVDAEIILQDMPTDNPIYEGMMAIRRSGQRAHAVVKRLLSTARRNPTDETAYWLDIYETIRNTLELVTTHIERSHIKLEVEMDTQQPAYILALPGHLEDVWLNLLLNAHDALLEMPQAKITLKTAHIGNEVQISICDNGPGIAPEHLEHLFDAFFTTKPAGEGTGLGLYICKKIVDQCQGTIKIESTLNEGTCFIVSLPIRPN